MNRKTHGSAYGIAAVLFASQTSCKPTQFQSLQKSPQIVKVSQSLTCSDEKMQQLPFTKSKTNEIYLSKSCKTDASTSKTPADIVFVIDITGSMEDSLNAVKNGVEQFARKLRQDKGWDARFAAVGYRDAVETQIKFSDEGALSQQMKDWEADGGRDPQEAGQHGIKAAVDLIVADAAARPERASASKTILYIADAVAYALNGLHADFSTARLEESFATLAPEIKTNLRFYHSTAKEVDQCLEMSFFGCARKGKSPQYAAYPQISEFAKKIALPGRAFEFPFSESILLNEFVDEFTPPQSCSLKSAKVMDKDGKQIGSVAADGRFDVPQVNVSEALTFEVERCCEASSSGPAAKSSGCAPSVSTFTLTEVKKPSK